VASQKRRVGLTSFKKMTVQRESHRHVGAGSDREVQIGRPRQWRGPRVYDDKLRPSLLAGRLAAADRL
jgi:hypothetical protein